MKMIVLAIAMMASIAASAEYNSYGSVSLNGLARANDWPLNPPGYSNVMVCNVNGPDGFLTVRSCPSTSCSKVRAFNRLAVLVVDTRYRNGNWVWVTEAYRNHDKNGNRYVETQHFAVEGWAHDGYMCSFLD